PDDHHEAEADRVADLATAALAGGPAPTSPVSVSPVAASAHGKDADATGGVPDSVHAAIGSAGSPLAPAVQRQMRQAFGGHDFGGRRVHTDGAAAQSAADVGARAYTVGSDVVFGQGQYNPESAGGQSLLAHELTHTLQQGGAGLAQAKRVQRKPPGG